MLLELYLALFSVIFSHLSLSNLSFIFARKYREILYWILNESHGCKLILSTDSCKYEHDLCIFSTA